MSALMYFAALSSICYGGYARNVVSMQPLAATRLRLDGSNLADEVCGMGCNFAVNNDHPEFTWAPQHTANGHVQTQYRIIVQQKHNQHNNAAMTTVSRESQFCHVTRMERVFGSHAFVPVSN